MERYAVPTGLRIKGAPIKLHWTFLMLLSVHLVLAFVAYNSWNVFWYELVLYGPFLFATVLMHEISRVVVTYKLGGTADTVILWPLGGLTTYGPNDRGSWGDAMVALAGPLSHIFTGAIFAILYVIFKAEDMPSLFDFTVFYSDLGSGFNGIVMTACRVSFCWNVFLLCVHIFVPVFPLDGIRIWVGLMMSAGFGMNKTANIVAIAGMAFSFGFFVYGCVGIFFDTFAGGVTEFSTGVLLGGFGILTSKVLFDLNRAGRLSEHPIFGRSCYAVNGVSSVEVPSTANGTMSGTPMAAAQQADLI